MYKCSFIRKRIVFIVSVFLFSFSSSLQAKQFIVKTTHKISFSSLENILEPLTKKNIKSLHLSANLALLDVDPRDLKKAKEKFKNLTDSGYFEYVVENITIKIAPQQILNSVQQEQWALDKIGIKKAWEITEGRNDVTVAVIDTGIDWTHEDFVGRIWENSKEIAEDGIDNDNNGYIDDLRGWDFRDNDNDPMDITSAKNPGHGTHCAGIIAASLNDHGVSGVAPGVQLMPVRFLGADGSGDLFGAVKAIDYAIDNRVDVISASWGAEVTESQMKPVLEAIVRAEEKGIVFVAAAANNGKNNDITAVYPSNARTAISVSASKEDDGKPVWSNYGRKKVSLSAPGANILSTLPGNKYGKLSGTSMATPAVAGLVALLISHSKNLGIKLTPTQIKAIIQTTGDSVNIETACYCRISAANALNHLDQQTLTMVPFAQTIDLGKTLKINGLFGEGAYRFSSSDESIAHITETGDLTSKASGNVVITVEDQSGQSLSSKNFYVEKEGARAPQCPFQNPQFCVILCKYKPDLAFCQKQI